MIKSILIQRSINIILKKLIIFGFDRSLKINLNDIKNIDSSIDINEILIYNGKIGFVSWKKKNQFNDLYFYKNKNPTKYYKINKEQITFLITDTYQEFIYMFFVKDRDNLELIEKVTNAFKVIKNKYICDNYQT